MRELEIFLTIRPTPTICEFLGYSIAPDAGLFIEYLENGTLAKVLESPNRNWTDTVRAKTIFGFACGMMHLHNHDAMHRYLSPKNIMFDRMWEPRLVDFGFAKTEIDIAAQTRMNPGEAERYFAPEMFEDDDYGPPVDVFAFATIVWQIITGAVPWSGMSGPKIRTAVKRGDRLAIPAGTDEKLSGLLTQCWHLGPESRPPFYEIVKVLWEYDQPLFPEVDMTEYRLYRDRVFQLAFQSKAARLNFQRDWVQRFQDVRAQADAGSIPACREAGIMLSAGKGTDRDPVEARAYLTRAAEGGDYLAMYDLAVRCAIGAFGRCDMEAARHWMEEAAGAPGSVTARVELAVMLSIGAGGEYDHPRALRLLEEAANPPWCDRHAQFQLGRALQEGTICDQDLERARKYYKLAASAGKDSAVVNLALMELHGEGGPTDVESAIRTLEQAIDKGSATACANLAALREGKEASIPRTYVNLEEAERLWIQAARMGQTTALVKQAMKLKERISKTTLTATEKRNAEKQVVDMLKRAADDGELVAMNNYGRLRMMGYGMPKDPYHAFQYLIRSAELGLPQALETLAVYVEKGEGGIEMSAERARKLRERATAARSAENARRRQQ
jgi:TPR repeat protein